MPDCLLCKKVDSHFNYTGFKHFVENLPVIEGLKCHNGAFNASTVIGAEGNIPKMFPHVSLTFNMEEGTSKVGQVDRNRRFN